MRTSMNLPDDLLNRARQLAQRERTTVTNIVRDALRERLRAKRGTKRRRRRRALLRDGSGGLQPGVDISNSAELLRIMERDATPRR